MIVTIDYGTHQRQTTYLMTTLFCPSCGKQTVWNEDDPGDYYVGETYVCTSCDSHFTIQGPNVIEPKEIEAQVVKQLREAI
jgi:transposase-like protein